MTQSILFITRKWPPAVGGMETYSKRLTDELERLARVETIALPGRKDGRPPLVLSLFWFGLRAAWRAFRVACGYEIVLGADMAIWPLAAVAHWRNPRATISLSAHGTDVAYAFRNGLRAALYRAYLRCGARLLPKAKVFANSKATAALVKQLGFENMAVIPLAADTKPALTSATANPQDYVLFVGRLIERKGCGWFIRNVLPQLPEHISLKVAGTMVDACEQQLIASDRVEYLGPVFGDALAALRRNAIAVIAPNLKSKGAAGFEGFGLTAVEGAADGGVVLASAVDGITDAVKDAETGFLLPPEDCDAWRLKILEVASWPQQARASFTDNARQIIQRHYSWSRVATDTLCIASGMKPKAPPQTNGTPLVSVIMPAFNAERYLAAAIDSILSQTFTDFEFIIIDDASSDATPDILAGYAARDARIRVMRNDANAGIAKSLNRALQTAQGLYIARMDADDLSLPERFEKQVAFLDAHPDHVFTACGYRTIDADGKPIRVDVESTQSWECAWISIFRMPVSHPTMMVRSATLKEHNIRYNEKYEAAQDVSFVHELLRHGKGAALSDVLFRYRAHAGNISTRRRNVQQMSKLNATLANALALFPALDRQALHELFVFLHGDDQASLSFETIVNTITEIEDAFAAEYKLTSTQLQRMRKLSARWIAAAAVGRGYAQDPGALARFLWVSRQYLPNYGGEALAYVARRVAA